MKLLSSEAFSFANLITQHVQEYYGFCNPMLLGSYIMEGSKPGATFAAVWMAHRVVPLNRFIRHNGIKSAVLLF